MIIDAHVHFTPPQLKTQLLTMGEPYMNRLLNGEGSIQGWVSAEKMIADMDAAGIDKVLLVGEYYQRHENCVMRNNQSIDLVNRYPDRIMSLAIVSPNAGEAAYTELKRCLDAGLVGLGEINPYAQNFRLDDPIVSRLAELCIERNVPINLHVGEEVGNWYTGKSTTPLREYVDLAQRFPALKLIFAHWGGGLIFYELMPQVRKQLANVWYDTAASPLLYPTKRIFQTALTCIDPRKILYGSDYPLRIYPRKMRDPDFRPFVSAIRKCGLACEADVFGNNFEQMMAQASESAVKSGSISREMTLRGMLRQWPDSAEILTRYGLPTKDVAVPAWEPIRQAAAARGLSDATQDELMKELNELFE
ncbi:MAG: amidohydrolase family protein [Candidatus Promineifilaceae bacterium]